jgi:hypothetical protein
MRAVNGFRQPLLDALSRIDRWPPPSRSILFLSLEQCQPRLPAKAHAPSSPVHASSARDSARRAKHADYAGSRRRAKKGLSQAGWI